MSVHMTKFMFLGWILMSLVSSLVITQSSTFWSTDVDDGEEGGGNWTGRCYGGNVFGHEIVDVDASGPCFVSVHWWYVNGVSIILVCG